MKQNFIEKTAPAVIIFIVAALVSTFASGGISLDRERSRTERIFTDGVNADGMSVNYDLTQRTEAAYNLAGVAKRYMDEDGSVAELLKARETLLKAGSISEKYAANLELSVAADTLYSELKQMQLSDKDKLLAAGQYQDMLSHNDAISRDGYNSCAAEFNRKLEKFPAANIAAVAGIEPLEIFG